MTNKEEFGLDCHAGNEDLVRTMYRMAERFDIMHMKLQRVRASKGLDVDDRGCTACVPKGQSDKAILDEILRLHNLVQSTIAEIRALQESEPSAGYVLTATELLNNTPQVEWLG